MVNIRIMTENDLEVAKDLMIALCEEVNVHFDEDRWKESISRRISDDEIWGIHFLLVAEEGDRICGIAFSEVREEVPGGLTYGYISNVYVTPEERGKGIGKQLLLESIKSLNRIKVSKIRLNVRGEMKRATNLYKKLGFKEVYTTMEKE